MISVNSYLFTVMGKTLFVFHIGGFLVKKSTIEKVNKFCG